MIRLQPIIFPVWVSDVFIEKWGIWDRSETCNQGLFLTVAGLLWLPAAGGARVSLAWLAPSALGPVGHVLLLAAVQVQTWDASVFRPSWGSRSLLPIVHWPRRVTWTSWTSSCRDVCFMSHGTDFLNYFYLEYNCFTVLCWFLRTSTGISC